VPIWKEEMAINVKLHRELETKVEAALGDDSRKLTREESDAILRRVQEEHDRRKMAALRPLEIKHDNLRREYLAKVEPLLTAEQRRTFLLVQKDKPEDRAPLLADPSASRVPADEPKKEEPKDRRAQPELRTEPLPELGIIVIARDPRPRPLLSPEAVKKLELTPGQKTEFGEIESDYLRSQQASLDEETGAIRRVWEGHRTKLLALLDAGGKAKELTDAEFKAIIRKLEPEYRSAEEKVTQKAEQQRLRLRNDALAKVEALLTDGQRKTFARVKNVPELIGLPRAPADPFPPPRRMPPAAEDPPARRVMPPAKDD